MTETPQSYLKFLDISGLHALLAAACLVRLAGRMFMLAIVLYALARFHSTAVAGWLSFASVAPGLLVSPIAGAILDRIGPTRAIAVDMAVSSVLVIALVMTDWLGLSSISVMAFLVVLFSLTSPLSAAGVRTLLPRLVPSEALDRANGVDTAVHALVDVLGPALAGVLTGSVGPRPGLIVIGLMYGLAALAIRAIPNRSALALRKTSLLRQAFNGIIRVAGQPTLRGLAVSYSLYQVTWGILVVAVPVFAVRAFPLGIADLAAGLLWACIGIAGGIGALAAGHLRTAGRERLVMAFAMVLTAPAIWPIAASFGLMGLLAGLMVAGVLAGPIDVGVLTLRQRRTDPRELGRVLSVSMSLNMAGFPIGTALGGVLLFWSVSFAFVAAAVTSTFAAIAAITLIPRHDESVLY
jgi:predicted MFS family arabinose efflux permease